MLRPKQSAAFNASVGVCIGPSFISERVDDSCGGVFFGLAWKVSYLGGGAFDFRWRIS